MTDRIHSITLVLEENLREDDVQVLIEACKLFKSVISVEGNVADHSQHTADARARQVLGEQVWGIIYPKTK